MRFIMKNVSEKESKNHHVRQIVLLTICGLCIINGIIFSHFGGFGIGKTVDVEEFSKYAMKIGEMEIPENSRIVALGEATHGNVEFQQLKKDVFRTLVEKNGVRVFALEGDFGGCEKVNRFIHGEEGTCEEAAAAIGFAMYRTKKMCDLISWMKEYNSTAESGKDLRFYGFDMQRRRYICEYINEFLGRTGIENSGFAGLENELENLNKNSKSGNAMNTVNSLKRESLEFLWNLKKQVMSVDYSVADKREIEFCLQLINVLQQNMEISFLENGNVQGACLRDKYMAENIMWILNREEEIGEKRIFISGANGHIEKQGSYDALNKVMGNILADYLGDGYFSIGTDFCRSKCNLASGKNGRRKNHVFYSHDPLANAARKCQLEECILDFSLIPQESVLRKQIDEYIWMGSIGDFYSSLLMNLVPYCYRTWRSPSERFDCLILVSRAHPIKVMDDCR